MAAAVATLAEKGYSGATARAIADRADRNQALVFYHFGSVDDLLVAALDAVAARRMATIGALVDEAKVPQDFIDILEHLVTEDVRNGDLAVLVALVDGSRGNPGLAQAVGERLAPWQDLTERAIGRFLHSHPLGSLVAIPVPDLAWLAMAAVLGMELLSVLEGQGAPSVRELAAQLRALTGPGTPA